MTSVPDELDRRFREPRRRPGSWTSPMTTRTRPSAELLVATSERGLCRISFDPEPERDARLARDALSAPACFALGAAARPVRRELDEYFEGGRHEFDLTVDLRPLPRFQREVLEELAASRTATSTPTARSRSASASRSAARAVGGALNRNPMPIVVPCHRIVGASGSLTGYGGGLERKEALLGLEGAILPG